MYSSDITDQCNHLTQVLYQHIFVLMSHVNISISSRKNLTPCMFMLQTVYILLHKIPHFWATQVVFIVTHACDEVTHIRILRKHHCSHSCRGFGR